MESEIWSYRTRTGNYRVVRGNTSSDDANAEAILLAAIDDIKQKVVRIIVHEVRVVRVCYQPIPTRVRAHTKRDSVSDVAANGW